MSTIMPLTAPNGRVFCREELAREAEDVEPTGVTLPRSWEEYRLEAEFANHEDLVQAVEHTLHDVMLTPQRYAELLRLLDSWFVEDRDSIRRETVRERPQRQGA